MISIEALHPLETGVLLQYDNGAEFDAAAVSRDLSLKPGQANQAFSWLIAKGLIDEVRRSSEKRYDLTERGKSYAQVGPPEERILALLRLGPTTIAEIASDLHLEHREVGSAYGRLARLGAVVMDGKHRAILLKSEVGRALAALMPMRDLLDWAADRGFVEHDHLSAEQRELIGSASKKRGSATAPFRLTERESVHYRLSELGVATRNRLQSQGITGDEAGALTTEMLRTGSWRGKRFRAYNIDVPPSRVLLGRPNPYGQFLEWVKDRLISLGFEEFDGPLVETEFWNCDALFMPQFHAARDIHDAFNIAEPSHAGSVEGDYLERVAAVHETGGQTGSLGWRYRFDRQFAKRLILRTQGTAISARTLPTARIPGKYFGVVRCFRHDQVDATHLSDFYQTEGIVLGEEATLRTLLGILQIFAEEVAGAQEVRYVPGYFPFTEPSVEIHIKHPVLGWFELGGSGIFRPEVTEPLGITTPVLAWGLGIDRMALMQLGLNDLRDLFSSDIEDVRLQRGR